MAEPPAAAAPEPCCVCGAPGGKHCTQCKSRGYCSKMCQLVDWKERGHKAQCKQMAAEFQDRLLDVLMPAKLKIKEAPPVIEATAPAAGFKAVPVFRTEGAEKAKAAAASDDAADWRGTCAICLDSFPCRHEMQRFYECCCKMTCIECSLKCFQHDERCPLCRTPASKSEAEVLRRMQKHVDKGNAEAQLVLGDAYREGRTGLKKSLKRAAQLYELAAAQGHVVAQVQLGFCYTAGDSVKINFKTAARWFKLAAEQGYPSAQYNLGQLLFQGTGVAQSHDEAVKWYRLAAAQGNANALYYLGLCLEKGQGAPRDYDEALRLYARAAAQGHAQAAAAAEELAAERAPTSRR